MKEFSNGEFDITITSPPYGDNHTTVPYGEFSYLPMKWINSSDLDLEGWEFDYCSSIDNHSMGGSKKKKVTNSENYELIEPFLDKICNRKKSKVEGFFADYFDALEEIVRITDKNIALTLGNRTVDRVKINLSDITKTFIERRGFSISDETTRTIPVKRIPSKTSIVDHEPVDSITKEFMMVFSSD